MELTKHIDAVFMGHRLMMAKLRMAVLILSNENDINGDQNNNYSCN